MTSRCTTLPNPEDRTNRTRDQQPSVEDSLAERCDQNVALRETRRGLHSPQRIRGFEEAA